MKTELRFRIQGMFLVVLLFGLAGCQTQVVREYSEDTTTIISSEQTVGGVPPAPAPR